MTKFQAEYLNLLRSQVEFEINFLLKNGHGFDSIKEPCPFCADRGNGAKICSRMNELKRFLSGIMGQQAQLAIKSPRQRIGYEVRDDVNVLKSFEIVPDKLPLLSVKL